MLSRSTIRLCPACQTGYIMGYNLHDICEGCLRPDNVGLAHLPFLQHLPLDLPFTDDLACKFAWERPNQQDPVWPHFPAITAYLSGEAAELLQLKAPVDQIRAGVTDHSYQCATHAAAVTNSIALIAYAISKKTRVLELPPEDAEDISNFTDTILNLCATSAVCRLADPAAVSNVALSLLFHLKGLKKGLLDGLISLHGLFGPHFQSVLEHLQSLMTSLLGHCPIVS
ncbi:hypothetical protein CRENBAI_009312 [Crenichthys baileyi]|uniref:Uncharacterized protein n=1 Tax=Crenichthys baileyi TaxID=28760 RepID=A0AAV9QNW1_9TELE